RSIAVSHCNLRPVFADTPTTEIYTLSLHDALPICAAGRQSGCKLRHDRARHRPVRLATHLDFARARAMARPSGGRARCGCARYRSEEHTSELQSRENLVCRLLLEKKKKRRSEESAA